MSDTQQDFEKLIKLLKLKRHEVPPPGYFTNFSAKIISRIEAADGRENVSWFKRMLCILETNPFAAGAFGASICGVLVAGITYSQFGEISEASANTAGPSFEVADSGSAATSVQWTKSSSADSITPSTDPMFSTNVPGALFNNFDRLNAQQVSFTVTQ
jgi:hypothetical protein